MVNDLEVLGMAFRGLSDEEEVDAGVADDIDDLDEDGDDVDDADEAEEEAEPVDDV